MRFPTYKEFEEYLNSERVLKNSEKKSFNCENLRILPENVAIEPLAIGITKKMDLVDISQNYPPEIYEKDSLICIKMCGISHYSHAGNRCSIFPQKMEDDRKIKFKCGYDGRILIF